MGFNSGKIKVESSAKKKTNPFGKDVIVDPLGQWAHPGQITKIPSGDITMNGVPYPVYGMDELGNGQMMYPGMNYQFPGNMVTEYPMMQKGGIPKDYDAFLKYSETAPENRRPDASYEYGNPRQYDHYGMWDALGKPKDFTQALEMNPDWQPDPYDEMYHGYSVNPNTGVWLKPHIPGEHEPGSTAWMEYAGYHLSPDLYNNFSVVYDPELQRMKGIERKQKGGTTTTTSSNKETKPYFGDFLYTPEELDYLNSEAGKEYCPFDGDCLSTAFQGYDKMVASRHPGFPSQNAIKEKYGFASVNPDDYYYSESDNLIHRTSDKKPVSPKMQKWFESQPSFNLEGQNFTVDSWDAHGQLVSRGGINLFNDEKGSSEGWAESKLGKMSDAERKKLYSQIPIGALVGLGGSKYGTGYNAKYGLPSSRHSAEVVGYTADGVPVIYDFGKYVPLDQNKFNMAVSNITYPKEFEGKTKSYFESTNSFDGTPTKLNLDYSALVKAGADKDELKTFYNTLKNKKVELMNDLSLNNSEYDNFAKLLLAESMQETGGGSAFEHNVQSSIGTTFGDTQGLTQLNINNILDDEQLAPIAKKYGIKKESDLHDPKKAAIASMIYAKRNSISSKKNFEKGKFKEGQTGVRTYSPRTGFANTVRDMFQPGSNIVYDGYTYNTEEGYPVDFVTGNAALGWNKDLTDIQSQFENIAPGRYTVYDDKQGNRLVNKTTYGNADLTDEQKFIYNWQSPQALATGDAQGGSKHVQQVYDYYKLIKDNNTPLPTRQFGGEAYEEMELTDAEVKELIRQGYRIENV